jgi:phosphotriesterase-related protein
MTTVSTVRGEVGAADLGRTYMHEHVFILTPDIQQDFPREWGSEDERVADAVTRLRALAEQGVRTVVDPTVIDLGRYVPRIQRIFEGVIPGPWPSPWLLLDPRPVPGSVLLSLMCD